MPEVAPAPQPADPATTQPVNVPITLTPSVASSGNGDSSGHRNMVIIYFLGAALLIILVGDHLVAERLITHRIHKSVWDFLTKYGERNGRASDILMGGLLGAVAQRAIDAIAGGKK